MSGGEKAVIVVVLLIVLLLVGGAAAVYLYWSPIITRTSFSPGNVTVTGVFLVIIYPGTSFQNNTTGYFGNAYREISFVNYLQPNQIFTATFTLTNREHVSHRKHDITGLLARLYVTIDQSTSSSNGTGFSFSDLHCHLASPEQ